MSDESLVLSFEDEDGQIHHFEVVETTTIAGREYLLLQDPSTGDEDEEYQAYIMRKTGEEEDDAFYEFVSDETELQSVFEVFEQLLEDEVDFD